MRFRRAYVKSLGRSAALPSYHAFVAEPLSRWIESTFGVTTESGTGRLIRATPRSVGGLRGAAAELAALTGADAAVCAEHIKEQLLVGSQVRHPETGFPVFAFRLHQFISRGETVYASIEAEGDRYLTLHPQKFRPRRPLEAPRPTRVLSGVWAGILHRASGREWPRPAPRAQGIA